MDCARRYQGQPRLSARDERKLRLTSCASGPELPPWTAPDSSDCLSETSILPASSSNDSSASLISERKFETRRCKSGRGPARRAFRSRASLVRAEGAETLCGASASSATGASASSATGAFDAEGAIERRARRGAGAGACAGG